MKIKSDCFRDIVAEFRNLSVTIGLINVSNNVFVWITQNYQLLTNPFIDLAWFDIWKG